MASLGVAERATEWPANPRTRIAAVRSMRPVQNGPDAGQARPPPPRLPATPGTGIPRWPPDGPFRVAVRLAERACRAHFPTHPVGLLASEATLASPTIPQGAPAFMSTTLEAPARTASLVAPHGGTLVDRIVTGAEADAAARACRDAAGRDADRHAGRRPRDDRRRRHVADRGLPRQGRLRAASSSDCRLADGTVWSLPITLRVHEDVAGDEVALASPDGQLLAVMQVTERYEGDKDPRGRARLRHHRGGPPGRRDPLRPGRHDPRRPDPRVRPPAEPVRRATS